MFTLCDIVISGMINFFFSLTNLLGLDMLFVVAMSVEVLFVLFFLIKSAFSYEANLNRALDKLNYWLFEKKVVTEENIKDLNMIFKTKAPKRLCYYWQQYILFRDGSPSSYLSTDNLVEKPLKTSSYNSNIKNLTLFTTIWALFSGMLIVLNTNNTSYLLGNSLAMALLVSILVGIIGLIFIVYMRARKNAVLNALYQNVSIFGRFMDNACVDLPSYIDYQILFTPQEIEKGQPVLREFLDYKARKEKEEFNKAKEENISTETYDFSSTGIDGSILLDRAMRESELYLNKKEKILVRISQLEAELDSRRKNFDNVQKDYQTKIQASKENVNRLRQMQEETTNRIESNFYRKQQTQEITKQEQYEQEFEQLRAKYLLEKNECEEEIKNLNKQLDDHKNEVKNIMIGEYSTFFDKFCKSAEKVVGTVFADKIDGLKAENEKDKQYITELEIKLKNVPQGEYDANSQADKQTDSANIEGHYDEKGNYVYPNGTYYDPSGNYHDEKGNVYSQDGVLLEQAKPAVEEKKVVDFDSFDDFDFMTDVSQKGDIYSVAENVIHNIDKDVDVINNSKPTEFNLQEQEQETQTKDNAEQSTDEKTIVPEETEAVEAVQPKRKVGRPKKIVKEEKKPAGKRGRPRKVVQEPVQLVEKKKPGRPKKIVNQTEQPKPSRGRGRPKKQLNSISEINKKLTEEQRKLEKTQEELKKELENAMTGINTNAVDDNRSNRERLINEIETLQKEAQEVMKKKDSESKLEEINSKLEKLLQEVKNLNE